MKNSLRKKRANISRKSLLVLIAGFFILNGANAQTYISSDINTTTTWTPSGNPYIITGNININVPGGSLTIQPGVIVEFNNNTSISDNGSPAIMAIGTATDSIIFTSSAVTPFAGIYGGIAGIGEADYSYCRFSYANTAINEDAQQVTHCLFTSNLYGLYAANTGLGISSCTFKYDTIAIDEPAMFIDGCNFQYNGIGILEPNTISIGDCLFKHNNYGYNNTTYPNNNLGGCVFDSNKIAILDTIYNQTNIEYNTIEHNNIGIISEDNTISSNYIYGNKIGIETKNDISISCNTLCSNTTYNMVAKMGSNENVSGNYWCLLDSAHIQPTIYDHYQNGSLGYLYFTPVDTVPCVGPCVNNFGQPICIVTVDTANNKCEIIWGRTNSPPAGGSGSFDIYKDSTLGYELTHSQPLDSLSEYIDLLSNPSAGPVSYELSTVDSCGQSGLSAPHTTIYLTTTSGINAFILNWTAYVGFTPSKYRIFRGLTMGSMVQIDSVPNTVLTYTDSFPPLGSIYLLEAVSPSGACIPTHRANNISSVLSGSFSNGFNTRSLGINYIGANVSKLNIYPNPSNGIITLNYNLNKAGNVITTLVNELGQVVYTNSAQKNPGSITKQLNLEGLAGGIYSLRMQTDNSIVVRKVVIMKK